MTPEKLLINIFTGGDSPARDELLFADQDETYGYCNSCGEEMWDGDDECCEDGEWVPMTEED